MTWADNPKKEMISLSRNKNDKARFAYVMMWSFTDLIYNLLSDKFVMLRGAVKLIWQSTKLEQYMFYQSEVKMEQLGRNNKTD